MYFICRMYQAQLIYGYAHNDSICLVDSPQFKTILMVPIYNILVGLKYSKYPLKIAAIILLKFLIFYFLNRSKSYNVFYHYLLTFFCKKKTLGHYNNIIKQHLVSFAKFLRFVNFSLIVETLFNKGIYRRYKIERGRGYMSVLLKVIKSYLLYWLFVLMKNYLFNGFKSLRTT